MPSAKDVPDIPAHSDEQLGDAMHEAQLSIPAEDAPPLVASDPHRPNITPVQIVGLIPLIAEFAHSFGIFNMTQPQQDSLSKLVWGAIGLFGADAVIRFGRNLAHRL